MDGPSHYREAEKKNDRAMHYIYGDGADPLIGVGFAVSALVDAMLANTAATAVGGYIGKGQRETWIDVAS